MRAVVIGAGIAGLAAAYELVKAGHRPVVIEPGTVGGMISSEQVNGFTLERGPNVLVERPSLIELVKELGLTHALRYPVVKPYGQYVWFNNRAQKVPSGLLEVLSTPLISLRAKLALPVRIALPSVLKPRREDESVELFFSRLIGVHAARVMLDPVLKGIYGGNVDELSARSIFHQLWDAGKRGRSVLQYMRERPKGGKPAIFVIEGGIQTLVDALWRRLRSEVDFVSDRVSDIARVGSTLYRIVTESGRAFECERCIVTVAGASLAEMTRSLAPQVAKLVSEMKYASLTVVHLSVPRAQGLIKDAFGVLCPAGMPQNFLGVMFNSQIFPGMAPPDKHLLTVILGGAQAGEGCPDEEQLKETVPQILADLFNVRGADLLAITHWRRAIPQLVVGHHRLVSAFDQFENSAPGFVFAGVDRGGVGVSDRIRIAHEAVHRSAAQFVMQAAS